MAAILWLRLAALGARPMHHDESLDAWFSWRLSTGQGYEYDPVYHGPLRIILTAGVFRVFGTSDVTARLLTATCGLALLATPLLVRRALGRVSTVAAIVALAISPSLVYFARFGREDMPFALAATVASLGIVEYLRQPRPWLPPLSGVSAAAAATCHEESPTTPRPHWSSPSAGGIRDVSWEFRPPAARLPFPWRCFAGSKRERSGGQACTTMPGHCCDS